MAASRRLVADLTGISLDVATELCEQAAEIQSRHGELVPPQFTLASEGQ